MIKDSNSKILYNKKIGEHYRLLGIKTGWGTFQPGQFVMVQVPRSDVFIRRPFSICRPIDNGSVEIFYKVVGHATEGLSEVPVGVSVNVLGPLGRGFSVPDKPRKVLLVAGGFGVAPFMGMLTTLRAKGAEIHFYYGGRSKDDLFFLDDIKKEGANLHVTTDDGSFGAKGFVTDLLLKDSSTFGKDTQLFCCGPDPMTKAVIDLARRFELPAEVSYETYMGCGIGVCLGCAVQTKTGFKRACKEGPVFDISEL